MAPNNDENKITCKTKIEKKVNLLLSEGYCIYCDESSVDYEKIDVLPDWYDAKKFKNGQKFFHDNIFTMLFAKLCGLLTILVIPTILNILKFTNLSSTPLSAYRRYMATIYHVTLWYDKDFNPESQTWKSIRTVRKMHFAASKRASNNKINRISQADMVLTQFGFIGYIMTHPQVVGIHNVTDEQIEGFVHLWRVVGYALGIEDRFNLCSGTVEETREYCNLLMRHVFAPRLEKTDEDFKQMTSDLVDGMTVFQPFINYKVLMTYIYQMCDVPCGENDNDNTPFSQMNSFEKFMLRFTKFVLFTYQYYLVRIHHNWQQRFALFYIIKYFPFLAYKKFGFKDGHLPENIRKIY